MFKWVTKRKLAYAVIVAAILMLIAALYNAYAFNDDKGDGATPSPSPSATVTPTPAPSASVDKGAASAEGSANSATLILAKKNNAPLFKGANLAPGEGLASGSAEFTNAGTLSMQVKPTLTFKVSQKVNLDFISYTVHTVKIDTAGTQSDLGVVSGSFDDIRNPKAAILKPGEQIRYICEVRLHESAGNDYQGLTISGTLKANATQKEES